MIEIIVPKRQRRRGNAGFGQHVKGDVGEGLGGVPDIATLAVQHNGQVNVAVGPKIAPRAGAV